MTNSKENNLGQIQEELSIIKTNASDLKIDNKNTKETEESIVKDNTIMLTEVVDNPKEFPNNISNSELIFKLSELQSNINNQQKIVLELINKLSEVK